MASSPPPAWATYSLRGRLLWLLLIAVALAALVQAVIAYYAARAEADEIFDHQMEQIALVVRGGLPLGVSTQRLEGDPEDPTFDFVIQVWTRDGAPVFASKEQLELPRPAAPGFSEVTAHGARYRVYSMQTPTEVIQVAQEMAAREELAGSLVLRMVSPVMMLVPILMLAVWWVVTQSTRPLVRARQQIARRAADGVSPLG